MAEQRQRRRTDSQPGKGSLFDRFIARWLPPEEPETLDWLVEADRAIVWQEPVRTRALLYSLIAITLLLLLWSAFAEIDEVTRGEAKVIPSRQVQLIQSLDGGVVTELAVREGDIVEAGQLLVRLDATRFASTLRENRVEYIALQVRAARLKAVAEGIPFEPSDEARQAIPDVVAQETTLYKTSMAELEAERSIAAQQLIQREEELNEASARREQTARSYELADQELGMTRPLFSSGAVSEVELLRLEREVVNLKGDLAQTEAQIKRTQSAIREASRKLEEVQLDFKNKIREALSEITARINSLQESSHGLSDRVKLTAVRSPVRGTVKRLYLNTIGGVVLPGKEVIEIVPLDDALLLEAKISPKDIAFLTPQQKALVKFTAYDFVVYGGLEAVVEHIGADTEMDEKGNPFYIVRVRTLESSLGEDKPIIPGMVAEVDILTGKKTILAYLMKPVLRAKQYALSER